MAEGVAPQRHRPHHPGLAHIPASESAGVVACYAELLVVAKGILHQGDITIRGQILVEPYVQRIIIQSPYDMKGFSGMVGGNGILSTPPPEPAAPYRRVAQRSRVRSQYDTPFTSPFGYGILGLLYECL